MPSRFAAVTNKEILQLIKLAYSWQLLWKITALNRLSFSEVDKSLVLYRFFSRFFRALWFKPFQDISIGVFQILKAFNAFVVMYLFYVLNDLFTFFLEMCERRVQKGPCSNISEGYFLAIAEENVAIALHKLRNTNRFYVNISWIPPPGRLITYM